ncbi:protein-L-isoaspartate(D-aspartate) O-methyltransferase [Henriciella aquimarina]|uniref:protein-L-isoaspartate(D-aspartate) O-methyltransferase n=1 Tax=Henriciella aquimarina TaxID=545261 RepID=UPI000A052570|nr:protein-L-isoaspartate(D-aspartate) O-methyltransferase [Henriciella aquimarina]
MTDYRALREEMVETQLVARGISDKRVLAAMAEVPRERFMPAEYRAEAYKDGPVPIGDGQTISQPYIVALMVELAAIEPDDRVLDVGLGSGYAAAVCARIASHVYGIERHETLAHRARKTLDTLGYTNISIRTGDGTLGWPEESPFDAILVAAAGPVPPALQAQLVTGGRLVMPVATEDGRQVLTRLVRVNEDRWEASEAGGVSFVPLIQG